MIAVEADDDDIVGDLQTIKAREPAEAAIMALAAMDIESPEYGLPELPVGCTANCPCTLQPPFEPTGRTQARTAR